MTRIFLLIAVAFCHFAYSKNPVTEIEKTESLIQIWGLLKYHHPEISKGVFNWNEEFVKEFDKIASIDKQDELNSEFISWIQKFDNPKNKLKINITTLDSKNLFRKNADFNWISNSNFNPELTALLDRIRTNTNISNFYATVNFNNYPQFKNEIGYEKYDSTLKSNRLLFLASFWNAMRYWNVNIYLTDTLWSKVLIDAVPAFMDNDLIKYEMAKFDLTSQLSDSHATYDSNNDSFYPFKNYSNLNGRIINDSLVITHLINPKKSNKDSIFLGDIVFSVRGITFGEYNKRQFSKVLNHSNNNFLKYASANFNRILSSDQDSLKIGIADKNGSILYKYLHTGKYERDNNSSLKLGPKKRNNWEYLTDNIGYVNLSVITTAELKSAFSTFKNTDGLVIDLRNYPKNIRENDICKYLYPTKKVFVKVLSPISPSFGEYDVKAKLRFLMNPFSAGRKNKNFYKGKVVLLVDRETQSNAEWIGMAIQNSPNCITVGEQTSGAVMNITRFKMVDQSFIYFTSGGAFYPDDFGAQRNGLKIDYEVQESALNYNPNLYVEEAIKIIDK